MPGQDGAWKKGPCPEYAGAANVNRLGEPKGVAYGIPGTF